MPREQERVYLRGRTWWCWYYQDGRRIYESTGCRGKVAAEAHAREAERRGADPLYRTEVSTTLSDALQALLDQRGELVGAGKRSSRTVDCYRQKAGHLCRILGADLPLVRLTAALVDEYIGQRRAEAVTKAGRTVTDHTIKKELVVLQSALKLAKRAGTWRGDLGEVMPVGFGSGYKPRSRYLTLPELQRLLATLDADWAARVAFAVATSAEWSAMERARRSDVAEDRTLVRVRGTKNSKRDRVVPIIGPGVALLGYALEHGQGEGDQLFLPARPDDHTLARGCVRAGIPHASWNDLRRTYATWLKLAGARSDCVAPAMGHADSRMVETVYGRLSPEALRGLLQAQTGCSTVVTVLGDSVTFGGLAAPSKEPNSPGISVGHIGLEPIANGLRVRGEKSKSSLGVLLPAPRGLRPVVQLSQKSRRASPK